MLDGDHWYQTTRTLGEIGPAAKVALPKLRQLLETKTKDWQQHVITTAVAGLEAEMENKPGTRR